MQAGDVRWGMQQDGEGASRRRQKRGSKDGSWGVNGVQREPAGAEGRGVRGVYGGCGRLAQRAGQKA